MSDGSFEKKEEAYLAAKARVKEASAALDDLAKRISDFARHLSSHGWQSLRFTNETSPYPANTPFSDEPIPTLNIVQLPTRHDFEIRLDLHQQALSEQRAAWSALPESLREILSRACLEASKSRPTDRHK
jgi:hypothetical protein